MQSKLITLLLIFGAFTMQAQIQTPQPSPSAKVYQTIGLSEVSVDYSRPAARGRVIFGDLVPYGKIWRTGANMRTKFTTDSDLTIDGKELKKGTYAILTIPNKESWDIIFYTEYQHIIKPNNIYFFKKGQLNFAIFLDICFNRF